MKKCLIVFASIFLTCAVMAQQTYAQAEQEVCLKASTQFLHPFFSGFHQINYRNELAAFSEDYRVKVDFSIDTAGSIVNPSFENKNLPEAIKSYVKKLLLSSNGLWQLKVRDGQKLTSSKVTGIFLLSSKKLSLDERADRTEKILKEVFSGKDNPEFQENASDHGRKNFFTVMLSY